MFQVIRERRETNSLCRNRSISSDRIESAIPRVFAYFLSQEIGTGTKTMEASPLIGYGATTNDEKKARCEPQ